MSGLNVGFWSARCEKWFETRLEHICEGVSRFRDSAPNDANGPLSATQWKRSLKFNNSTPKMMKNMDVACYEFLLNKAPGKSTLLTSLHHAPADVLHSLDGLGCVVVPILSCFCLAMCSTTVVPGKLRHIPKVSSKRATRRFVPKWQTNNKDNLSLSPARPPPSYNLAVCTAELPLTRILPLQRSLGILFDIAIQHWPDYRHQGSDNRGSCLGYSFLPMLPRFQNCAQSRHCSVTSHPQIDPRARS